MADVSSTPSVTSLLQHCYIIVTSAVLASRAATEHQEQMRNLILIFRFYLKCFNEKQDKKVILNLLTNKKRDKTRNQF